MFANYVKPGSISIQFHDKINNYDTNVTISSIYYK